MAQGAESMAEGENRQAGVKVEAGKNRTDFVCCLTK